VGERKTNATDTSAGETTIEPMREDSVRTAIKNLSGGQFERLARELLRRELYPGLNPTSASHDLGEDARTEQTTIFLNDGLRVSVIASKTARWSKIQKDCKRCRDTGRQIDVVVFATSGSPRTTTQENWRNKVQQEFGWHLEVRTIEWLGPVASAPRNEDLVDDYLHIPPLGGDYVGDIQPSFLRQTNLGTRLICSVISGMSESLPRDEVARVEDQLASGRAVLLTGDAGTGKSGIALELVRSARESGLAVLYLDARRFARAETEVALRQHIGLKGSVSAAIGRIGKHQGCRLIIDQLDYITGSVACQVLVELAVECCEQQGVQVVVASRKTEAQETKLLSMLDVGAFVELTSYPLTMDRARCVLQQLGISDPSKKVTELATNLLNLELIARVKTENPTFDFRAALDEIDIWEHHRLVLEDDSERVVAGAIDLARRALSSDRGSFDLDYPLLGPHRRLISWGVVVCEEARIHRFRHEKYQEYLYAWDATQRLRMPRAVCAELGAHRSRGVLTWMDKIYARQSPVGHEAFMKEMLGV
jgi:hypothetical protein